MKALITGITGQDGSYLAELLLDKGYEVHGIVRRASQFNTQRIDHVFDNLHLHFGDMTDGTSLRHVLYESQADEVYNLAAQSHVKVSFECSEYTMDVNALGTLRLLEAIKDSPREIRMYQASTSEMYGDVEGTMNEENEFAPVSPYGIAKLAAHRLAQTYRMAYGLHVSCGILFNHESPRRGPTFITRKVCRAVARIKAGLQDKLEVGNLGGIRDWGYAPDYVRGMWLMLQQPEPDDYVLATGETHTVWQLCQRAFELVKLDWRDYTVESPRLKRPLEVPYLCGDASKAKEKLDWEPILPFDLMLMEILNSEMEALK